MFGFGGLSEVLFILFLAMLIFGPEKLPEIGRMLAKGMAEVRKASNELKRTLNAELAISEQEQEARRAQLVAVPPPPPAWSGGETVPNLPAPAGSVAAPGGEAPRGEAPAGVAASGGEAPAGEAVGGAVAADVTAGGAVPVDEAALISEAAYLADWPEDAPAAPSLAAPAHQHATEPPSSGSTDQAGSAAPAGAAEPAVALQAHGEGDGRESS